jgi:hypothetical protein
LAGIGQHAEATAAAGEPTMPDPDPHFSALLDQVQAAQKLNLRNPRTLAAWRLRRCGPPYRKLGKRLVRYDLAELLAWAARQEA